MASENSSLPTAMQSFLSSCSQTQLQQFIRVIQEAQSRNAAESAPNAASNMSAKAGVTAKKTGKKQRSKKAKAEKSSGGPKRPLNSWMAFRKYYCASLAPNTQKSISKVLTTMWREDPFEAKWSMLAKAYSIIRGSREKQAVPLDAFLSICAPLINMIDPTTYAQRMGWQLGPPVLGDVNNTPTLTRVFVPDFNTWPTDSLITMLSVEDLVDHCNMIGFADESMTIDQTSESIAMAVNPMSPTEEKLRDALLEALAEPPPGQATLAEAADAIHKSGSVYPHNAQFDPSTAFEISYNPNENGEDGIWDAYSTSMTVHAAQDEGVEWSAFIDDGAFP